MANTYYFSAPGRTELSGNHTDHQHGCVLAASVNLEATAEVQLNNENCIRIQSEGYPEFSVSLEDLSPRNSEKGTSSALVRGIAAEFNALGIPVTGFNAVIRSQVPAGSGLSSSAAFEVLIARILNGLFAENKLSPIQLAQICQKAENVYFGKPCGLMDQLTCSVGGAVFIDFADSNMPAVEQLNFDFSASGHSLCIIDTGADHAGLTEEYAAITQELGDLCHYFGKQYLRQIPEAEFLSALPQLRKKVSDRAILRAIHIYRENARVNAQANALKQGDFSEFLSLVNQSGRSSWMYLQNIYPAGAVTHQPVALALALCETLLNGRGACRVHGGGFAGTVLAFVPNDLLKTFTHSMEAVLGVGTCHVLNIS